MRIRKFFYCFKYFTTHQNMTVSITISLLLMISLKRLEDQFWCYRYRSRKTKEHMRPCDDGTASLHTALLILRKQWWTKGFKAHLSASIHLRLRRRSKSHPQAAHLISIHVTLNSLINFAGWPCLSFSVRAHFFRWIVRCFKINEQMVSMQVALPEYVKDAHHAVLVCWTEFHTWFWASNKGVLSLHDWHTSVDVLHCTTN